MGGILIKSDSMFSSANTVKSNFPGFRIFSSSMYSFNMFNSLVSVIVSVAEYSSVARVNEAN